MGVHLADVVELRLREAAGHRELAATMASFTVRFQYVTSSDARSSKSPISAPTSNSVDTSG